MTRDIHNEPWEELATNFFTPNQKDYLLICDTFSKYPFLFEMPKKSKETTITKFQQLFVQYDPARKLFTNNGWWFSLEKLTSYMIQLQVQHIILSPHSQMDSSNEAPNP